MERQIKGFKASVDHSERKQTCFRELIQGDGHKPSVQCRGFQGQGVAKTLHAPCAAHKRPLSTHTRAR